MTTVNNQQNPNQPSAAGGATMVGQKIKVNKNKIDDYITAGRSYEVKAQESPHSVLIVDDDGENCWINMFDCHHTGGKWSVV